ncbi:VOC family protein [Micromonospora rifamycinica]|uniref:VOC family protein n=1 Tax=Micromonospora rifamycinica TaxID=291594 RepID=UPI00340B206C
MAGEPSFIEFAVPVPERTRDFYEALFGWKFTMLTHGSYIEMPDAPAGLEAGSHPDTDPPHIIVYFAVDDLAAAVERVKELGGEVGPLRPPSPQYGAFAECRDSQGVAFGLRERPKAG